MTKKPSKPQKPIKNNHKVIIYHTEGNNKTMFLLLTIFSCLLFTSKYQRKTVFFRRKYTMKTDTLLSCRGNQKKPDWVAEEVIRLKAILGQKTGCRKVAQTFNRLHGHRETVGKTFVSQIIQKNQFEVMVSRRKIKNKLPRWFAVNCTWAMDLSFYTTADKITQPFIGIIDHGSRKAVSLNTIVNKSSWIMLGYLCLAIGKYGLSSDFCCKRWANLKKLRTDNESIFNSFVFRIFLKLVNIQHQKIPTTSPWCNGRIERLFGTLKPMLQIVEVENKVRLQLFLRQFSRWYNGRRPHQNLNGKTPDEVFRRRE